MKRPPNYFVIYYAKKNLSIRGIFIVQANDSSNAKRVAARSKTLPKGCIASATRVDTIKHTWHVTSK